MASRGNDQRHARALRRERSHASAPINANIGTLERPIPQDVANGLEARGQPTGTRVTLRPPINSLRSDRMERINLSGPPGWQVATCNAGQGENQQSRSERSRVQRRHAEELALKQAAK